MTDDLANQLSVRISHVFPNARRITVLALVGGWLALLGEPTGAEIHAAAMLLANVHTRLPSYHVYVTPAIPGPALLPGLKRADRSSMLVAPVLDRGHAVGAVIVEAGRGRTFVEDDLARLERLIKIDASDRDAA